MKKIITLCLIAISVLACISCDSDDYNSQNGSHNYRALNGVTASVSSEEIRCGEEVVLTFNSSLVLSDWNTLTVYADVYGDGVKWYGDGKISDIKENLTDNFTKTFNIKFLIPGIYELRAFADGEKNDGLSYYSKYRYTTTFQITVSE